MSKTAFIDGTPEQRETVFRLLGHTLACLRAQALSYQTSHWQVGSNDFYGDHLLFERLYESVQDQIDVLAEKMVGFLGTGSVQVGFQTKMMYAYVYRWEKVDGHKDRGLQSERDLQKLLQFSYDKIKEMGCMTLGLDDFIMATANAHEANQYLLQQAAGDVPLTRYASDKALLRKYRTMVHTPDIPHDEWVKTWGDMVSHGMTSELYPDELASGKEYLKHHRSAMVKQFFSDPNHREVKEFADTGAITNDPEVAAAAVQKDHAAPAEVALAEEAPPTPEEIVEMPLGKELSTLNRYVVSPEAKLASLDAWASDLD